MRFIHIADIHASKERLPQTLHILNTLTERCKEGDIDFILFAGDFWDSTITATKGSGFSDIISAIRRLEKCTYLFFIYGTPTHEPGGSLDAFSSGKTVVINGMFHIPYVENAICYTRHILGFDLIFIPEPRRSEYIGSSSEEINNKINESIRTTLERYKARCSKPLIVVYHGEVKGAVYQNGVSASSPTAIPKELLQSLNADYYALGHIHKPQEVFKNAWYSGSACPKDFGETHDGCYNLVEIENGETKVQQVSFGLPMYLTLYKDPRTVTSGAMDRTNLRFIFDCTKEERKTLNIKQLADEVKMKTGALFVKLEPTLIDSENTKKSEVSKRKSIVEKMIEYAAENSLKLPKYSKELLQDIQDNTLIKLAYPQHSFELLSLSLRGAIGIRDGQHKEEIELNFEKYDDGIVCLIGQTGKGKTTILENCHPYPCMLTRDGTLRDNFYLKDSHRILIYKDENGLYYRISMLIDSKNKTGKAVYFAETSKDKSAWTSVPDTDGSLVSYQKWVDSTFGNIDVFLRTAFFAKEQTKGTPDISATTKSERMELLSKLAGTDHLKEVSVIAREQRKEVEKTVETIELELSTYEKYNEAIKQNIQDISIWKKELKLQEKTVSDLEKTVSELKAKDTEYQKNKALNEANKALYEQYTKELNELKSRFDKLEEVVNSMGVYEKITESNNLFNENLAAIEEQQTKLNKDKQKLSKVESEVKELSKEITEYKLQIAKLESSKTLYESQITKVDDVCPTCGSPLSEHKKAELNQHITEVKSELDKVISKNNELNSALKKAETLLKDVDCISELKAEIANKETYIESLSKENDEYSRFLSSLDPIYKELTYDDAVEEHMKKAEEIKTLQDKINSLSTVGTLEDVSAELKEAEDLLRKGIDKKSELTATIASALKENERYQKELDTASEKQKELKDIKDKVTAYLFIENAFSNNGIPAIELRESAPEIADIANKILQESYGNKFSIRFGDTSELKVNRKANEDFNILVYDSENNDEKTIDLVSSGERIWIKQALFYAFSIVQMNRTGFNFRTRFIDESDGSLDGALRLKYLKMVTSAHKYSDSRITLLITHSQEIKDIAQQVIEI